MSNYTRRFVVEFTKAELDALRGVVSNGYGDGDYEQGMAGGEVTVLRRAMQKLEDAGSVVP